MIVAATNNGGMRWTVADAPKVRGCDRTAPTVKVDGTEQREDNMCSSEMSSALCEGIQTEIDRVFSNGMFIDNKLHFSDRVELLTELSYHTDHACDTLGWMGFTAAATGRGCCCVAVRNHVDGHTSPGQHSYYLLR